MLVAKAMGASKIVVAGTAAGCGASRASSAGLAENAYAPIRRGQLLDPF